MVAGLIAPIVAYRRWKGGWRIAAGVPLAGMCFVIVRIIVGTAIDPTSHNLWPFEIGMVAFLALAFIAVVAIARRVTGAHRG
jgi:membrane-associated PAP2 superfamily phosphatase